MVGNRYYTSRYHFFALECAGDEADRAENYDFLESLASWLEDQEDQGNYPELPGRYSVEGIAVQYATLYDVSQNGAGLYQVQIELTIKKDLAQMADFILRRPGSQKRAGIQAVSQRCGKAPDAE